MEKVGDSSPQPAVASSGEGGPRLQAHSGTVHPTPWLRPLRGELWVPLQVSRFVLLSFAQNCTQDWPLPAAPWECWWRRSQSRTGRMGNLH